MPLSPFEVERREFGRSLFGFRRSEVEDFVAEVRGSLAQLWNERSLLQEENDRMQDRIDQYAQQEEQLKRTLMLAQDSAERAAATARRESEVVINEARQRSREILHEAQREVARIEQRLSTLATSEREATRRIRTVAEDVLAQLPVQATAQATVVPARTPSLEGGPGARGRAAGAAAAASA